MPHRYEGRRIPAMLYAYPFDHMVAVVLVSAGALINLFPGSTPASIKDLDIVAATVFRLMCLVGGVLISIGLNKGRHRWSFTSEMVGMCLAAGVFGTYSIGLLGNLGAQPGGLLAFILMVALSLACLLRARALNIESNHRLQLFLEAGEIKRGSA